MLNNREFRIRAVKTNKKNKNEKVEAETEDLLNPENIQLIEEAANRFVKRVAITAVAVVAALKVIDTLGEIAVKKTKSADKE